jgi:protein TonB
MASAFLSLPPPWSFGSDDLRANARRFLQRALVISALVHLAAVGVFRAALERFAAPEEEVRVDVRHWSDPAILTPRITPIDGSRHSAPRAPSDRGVFEPTASDVPFPTINPGAAGTEFRGVDAGPREAPDPGAPQNPVGPRGDNQGFVYADTPPEPLLAPRPPYSTWAKEAGIEGKVLVRVLVGTDGIPKRAIIVRGPKGLTEGVESAVLRWRFRPGLANGRPVEVWVQIPISFRIGE